MLIPEVIKLFNIEPKKSLGQNFLLDTHITDQIVVALGDLSDKCVLEIGSGPGCLTISILEANARKVIAVETDERCVKALQHLREKYKERLEIIQANALYIDEKAFGEEKLTIIANLPYNIGTNLLLKWLSVPNLFESINIMLQKEVVDRICAEPNTPDYGRISIICQWLCDVYEVTQIAPENFFPPPKVTSSVVRIVPLKEPRYACSRKALEKVTQAAFSARRKMLKSSLKNLFTDKDLENLGINPTCRAEDLSIKDFCLLANNIHIA